MDSFSSRGRMLLHLSLTAVLLGYWLIWLPGPAAGLQLIGLEMGEWVKFLPEVRGGQVSAGRDLFYLPPITLGLMVAMLTAGWPRRWQTRAVRGLAVLVAWLAFPSLDALRFEPRSEWLLRLLWISLVLLVAVGIQGVKGWPAAAIPLLLCFIALIGAILPTWAYLEMRPAIANALARPVGFGPGFWLNGVGHGVAAALFWAEWQRGRVAK
ncbi:MAG: hypothetical protein KJ063_18050 [Anaerolineae bacterium]|nr:hypothetical protein [Anaerolineae bacterium]